MKKRPGRSAKSSRGRRFGVLHYRRADLGDVSSLARLRQSGEAGGASEDRMLGYLAGEYHPREALSPRAMWLAADGDAPLGYVAGHLTRRFGCDGELQWIYVVRQRRRSGVASHLLQLLAEWFVGQGARYICVDVGDDEARPFYRHHGAEELTGPWMVWKDVSLVLPVDVTFTLE